MTTDLAASRNPECWSEEVARSMMPWQPVIDGDVIPACPIDLITAGAAADIDLMVGTNTDEWRLFLVPGGAMNSITEQVVAGCVAAYGLPVEATLASYRAANPDATPGDLLSAIMGDWYFRIPVMRLADAHAKVATSPSTYVYEFAWHSPACDHMLGACHALEIPFVFDKFGGEIGQFLGASPHSSSPTSCTPPGSPSQRPGNATGRHITPRTEPPCGLIHGQRS